MVDVIIPAQPGFRVLLDFEILRAWAKDGCDRDHMLQATQPHGVRWLHVIGWRIKSDGFAQPILPGENGDIDWGDAVLMTPSGACCFVKGCDGYQAWAEMIDEYIKFAADAQPEDAQPQ